MLRSNQLNIDFHTWSRLVSRSNDPALRHNTNLNLKSHITLSTLPAPQNNNKVTTTTLTKMNSSIRMSKNTKSTYHNNNSSNIIEEDLNTTLPTTALTCHDLFTSNVDDSITLNDIAALLCTNVSSPAVDKDEDNLKFSLPEIIELSSSTDKVAQPREIDADVLKEKQA